MSSTGRFVLFTSPAGDLVTNAHNGLTQVFLRDRGLNTTVLVSATPEGAGASGPSIGYFVDEAGQIAVFQSDASDLTTGDGNDASDIYLRALTTGITTLLSANTNGVAGSGASRYPITTPDGRYVAFESAASDLVANDTNQAVDVFVRDVEDGLTTLASQLPEEFVPVAQRDYELNGISTNGQYVLFSAYCAQKSSASQIAKHVFLRDTVARLTHWISSNVAPMNQGLFANLDCSKAAMTPDANYFVFMAARAAQSATPADAFLCRHEFLTWTTSVIATNSIAVPDNSTANLDAAISADGRFIAYTLSGSAVTSITQVCRWDSVSGSNVLVSVGADGITPGTAASGSPLISSDGGRVIFQTVASNIVTQDIGGDWNVVVRDMDTGLTRLVSSTADGLAGAGADVSGVCAASDGKAIAYCSRSAMVVAGDANDALDVFLWKADSGETELISVNDPRAVSATVPGLHIAFTPSIGADGRFVGFASLGRMVGSGALEENYQAFVRDAASETTRLVTASRTGTESQNGSLSSSPSVSDDGRFVAFACFADNLNDMDTNRYSDVYVRDMLSNTNTLVSKNRFGVSGGSPGAYDPIMSPDGAFVLFSSGAPNMVRGGSSSSGRTWIYKYDMRAGTNLNIPFPLPTLGTYFMSVMSTSYDKRDIVVGFRMSWSSPPSTFGVFNLDGGGYRFVTNNVSGYAVISGDGQHLAYARRRSPAGGIELVNVDIGSRAERAVVPLDATALSALSLSRDGGRVAYAMVPSNPQVSSLSQVFVWDVAGGSNILVSVGMTGKPGDGSSKLVAITPDGNRVFFNSNAGDLVATDQNAWTDVYMRDLAKQVTRLVSVSENHPGSGNSLSAGMAVSLDGQSIVFSSSASDLIRNDLNGQADLFVQRVADGSDDSDADGLPDAWERLHFADLGHGPNEDADQDGSSNLDELKAETSPTDPSSVFRIARPTVEPGNTLRLTWSAVAGKAYRVQYSDDLEAGWVDLAGDITPVGAVAHKQISVGEREERYYRIVIVE